MESKKRKLEAPAAADMHSDSDSDGEPPSKKAKKQDAKDAKKEEAMNAETITLKWSDQVAYVELAALRLLCKHPMLIADGLGKHWDVGEVVELKADNVGRWLHTDTLDTFARIMHKPFGDINKTIGQDNGMLRVSLCILFDFFNVDLRLYDALVETLACTYTQPTPTEQDFLTFVSFALRYSTASLTKINPRLRIYAYCLGVLTVSIQSTKSPMSKSQDPPALLQNAQLQWGLLRCMNICTWEHDERKWNLHLDEVVTMLIVNSK